MERLVRFLETQRKDETVLGSQYICGEATKYNSYRGNCSHIWFSTVLSRVTQAYMQKSEKLMRDVYLKHFKEMNIQSNQLVQLLKPLYGLSESGDYWGRTCRKHLENELDMKSCMFDDALFSRF